MCDWHWGRSPAYNRTHSGSSPFKQSSKCSKSQGSSACKSQATNDKGPSCGQSSTANSFKYQLVHFNHNAESFITTSTTDQQTLYSRQYSTDVISGCISLGLEVSTAMQQALVDQHGSSTVGHYSYSTAVVQPQYVLDSQCLFIEASTPDWSCTKASLDYGYTCKKEDFHRDLVGIGAQFEARKSFWNLIQESIWMRMRTNLWDGARRVKMAWKVAKWKPLQTRETQILSLINWE